MRISVNTCEEWKVVSKEDDERVEWAECVWLQVMTIKTVKQMDELVDMGDSAAWHQKWRIKLSALFHQVMKPQVSCLFQWIFIQTCFLFWGNEKKGQVIPVNGQWVFEMLSLVCLRLLFTPLLWADSETESIYVFWQNIITFCTSVFLFTFRCGIISKQFSPLSTAAPPTWWWPCGSPCPSGRSAQNLMQQQGFNF